MADFKTAFNITMGNEVAGELSDNPADTGGMTYSGISCNNFPKWEGWAMIEAMRQTPNFPGCLAQNVTLQRSVFTFYQANFWNVLGLDRFDSQDLANELFDLGVNCGADLAAGYLQRSLNVLNLNGRKYPDITIDGQIGTVTLDALKLANSGDVLKCVRALQGVRYIQICERNKTQEVFMAGWIRRAFK